MLIVTDKRCKIQPGMKFGRIRVLGVPFRIRLQNASRVHFVGECECGEIKVFRASHVTGGASYSCGCYLDERRPFANRKHGERNTPLFRLWSGMKNRCGNPNEPSFRYYGGRGIEVCEEWRSSFETFRDWCQSNGYRHGLQIDRINNNGPYAPWNCRFADRVTQANNRSNNRMLTAFGETKNLTQWSRDSRCAVARCTLKARIEYGWTVEKAILEPSRGY